MPNTSDTSSRKFTAPADSARNWMIGLLVVIVLAIGSIVAYCNTHPYPTSQPVKTAK